MRRRRNEPTWARDRRPAKSDGGNGTEDVTEQVINDLLMCWGIGPSKVRQPDGFAFEALAVLDEDSITGLLEKSVQQCGLSRSSTGEKNSV